MNNVRRLFVIATFFFLLLAVALWPLIDQQSTAVAQTTDSPTDAWITLPQTWDGPASISQAEIATAMPPFALLEHQGEFVLTRVDADDSMYIRVQRAAEEQTSEQPGQLRFAWTITGEELAELTDQVLTVTFAARGYAPPNGVRFFIEEETDAGISSTSAYVNNVEMEEYTLSRAIAPEASAVRIGLDWNQALGAGWVEFSEILVESIAAAEYTGALAPTDAPTAAPTPTPTPPLIVVTSTSTPVDLFAAATRAAQAIADAQTTGTPTPTPEIMVTATPTFTPIFVTNTPTPGNSETATIVALEAEARAFTTGTPTPLPADAVVLVALPKPTRTPKVNPTKTPTPLFVRLADIPPTKVSTPAPSVPAELAGKIVFKANLFGTNRRPDYMIMNPDGSDVARLTGPYYYNRVAERDHYSGDRKFYAFNTKEQDGFHRIQLFYDFIEYGTQRQLTYFGAGTAWDPAWSPVDERVVLVSNESKNNEIWIVEREEWPAIQLTDNDWEWDNHPSFSPDGNQIVFMSNRESGQRQLWIMDADGGNQRQLSNLPFEAWDPVWVKYTD